MSEARRRTAVVTGANSGVGRAAAGSLLAHGFRVVLVCRSRERGAAARDELAATAGAEAVELELADLSDPSAVVALAERLGARHREIHALVNNAGVYRAGLERTPEGLEVTMATNHLGHFILTTALREPLERGAARIVNVTSNGHRSAKLGRASLGDIFTGAAWAGGIQAYCDSKLANVLFTFELVRRWAGSGVVANALHPGVLSTRIWNQNANPLSLLMRLVKPFMRSPRVGGDAAAALARDPAHAGKTGRYFDVRSDVPADEDAYDEALASDLWAESERIVADPRLRESAPSGRP